MKHKFVNSIKKLIFPNGEKYIFNHRVVKFKAGTRPVRRLNKFLSNEVNRNDILQIDYLENNFTINDILWDIGAHHGHYSIFAASMVENSNQIFAFEPDTSAINILRQNIRLNFFNDKITALDFAISNSNGNQLFEFRNGNANSKIAFEKSPHSINVQSRKLDTLIEDFPMPTYVKIDVEGAEFEVLKGGQKLLKDKNVKFICELHPFAWNEFKVNLENFNELLAKYDRRMIPIDSTKNESDLPFYGTVIF